VTPIPVGWRIVLDPSLRVLEGGKVLIGGRPGRLLTLTDDGTAALGRLRRGETATEQDRRLGRRLLEAGMAHPRPATEVDATSVAGRVTVVVPARDRPESLAACLASLRRTGEGARLSIVVVDDGSAEPAPIAAACRSVGARLLVRPSNGGPAAARNDGLAVVDTELVAFFDSDCTARGEWLARLLPYFEDPSVGAVAPRIRPAGSRGRSSALDRFAAAHSDLDMGDGPSEVGPDRPVRYVPAAALVARRSAVADGFDRSLRIGEDVDLVWRLGDAGWRVHYVPEVEVAHHEPRSWSEWMRRRFRYGTSAALLARRHPARLAPVELRPWPTLAGLALLAGRPRAALGAIGVSSALLARQVHGRGVPPWLPVRWSAEAAGWTVIGIGHAATMLASPVLAAVGRCSRRSATLVLALALAAPTVEWWRRRPPLDPARWALASLADDVAYGAGVWTGCLRSRSARPLLPALRPPWRSPPGHAAEH
jgi:mycofactocin glycosyltransferase